MWCSMILLGQALLKRERMREATLATGEMWMDGRVRIDQMSGLYLKVKLITSLTKKDATDVLISV